MNKSIERIFAVGFIILILCLSSLRSSAQQWLGNDPVISGSYSGGIGWNGTGTVNGTAIAQHATDGGGTLVINSGGKLTISGNVERSSVHVKTGGTLIINGEFKAKAITLEQGSTIQLGDFNITNAQPSVIATKVTVSRLTTIHNNGITFTGCAVLDTKDLVYLSAPNALLGVGLIKVSGSVTSNGNNSFTTSTSIYKYVTGTTAPNVNWGAASTSTDGQAACEVTTPIRFTNFNVVRTK